MRDISLDYYSAKLRTLSFFPEKEDVIKEHASLLLHFSPEYLKVSKYFSCIWEVIGLIHMMESSFDFQLNIHNGQPWFRKTTLVPVGRGPFHSWEASAIDAINMKLDSLPPVWSGDTNAKIAKFLEEYNGLGYAKYHDVNSPYLWSFSNHGIRTGKYTSDGKYDAEAVSSQPGAMVVLKYLQENLDELVKENKSKPTIEYNVDPSKFCEVTFDFQMFINGLVNDNKLHTHGLYHLKPDGLAGPETSDMCKVLFGFYLNGDPRKE